ncbi:MAG TPA: porin [Aquabacterium sp.]|uniref:porin n=1 Tax=Aquabacterium sp. TaxID=1872578 RepID=UPI002E36FCE6|nr:porin [Aquabacterium sp.]HEX5373304.1 porin [Aquabacterium sp.]
MKKTILAAAALLSLSGAALAQSVSIYGVLDASIESVKGTESVTRVTSDNYASSRLGFKGVEDLGDGLKAKFVLEHNVKVDTGIQGNTPRFWDRAAWVGLEGGFGELRLGRIDSSIGLLAGNSAILGAQAYDDLKIAKTFAGDKYRRLDNAITYYVPAVVPGLTAQIQYSTATGTSAAVGTEAKDDATAGSGTAFGLNVQYAAGPFGAGLGYINAKTDTSSAKKTDKGVLLYGSYDFGAAKLTAYYNQDSTSGTAEDRTLFGIKVGVPVTKDFSLQASVAQVKDQEQTANNKDDATIVAIKGVYNLSKRTALYALITTVSNDDQVKLNVGQATDDGKNAHGIAFGIRHSF